MEYYLSNNDGNFFGPFPMHQLLNAGMKRETMVWREGLSAWYPAYLLPELNEVINSTPPPLEITLNAPDELPPELPAEPKPMPVAKIARKPEPVQVEKTAVKPMAKPASKTSNKTSGKTSETTKPASSASKKTSEATKTTSKTSDKTKEKSDTNKKKKTKYDYPVGEWLKESFWLLAFVIIHVLLAIFQYTTFEYIYLDIFGAILCTIGIIIGYKIKALNKESYAKGSASRNAAEKLSKFNGFLVSATAAAGFLIILYQSAHYVYIC